jgi:integrase
MKPTKDQCDQKDKMPSFKMPTSEQEIYALQIATTQLLNDYFAGMTDRRLQARGIEPSTVKDPDDRKRMASIPSEVTRREYLKTGTRLLKNVPLGADVWAWTAKKSSSSGAWYKNRASLQHTLVARIRKAKRGVDTFNILLSDPSATPELIAKCSTALVMLVASANQLEAMPPGGLPSALSGDGKTKRPRQTKARSLRGLPDNWRETVAAMMPKPVRICWLTQCLTGARPAEIAKGVRVTVDDGKLILIVSGAKVRKGHSGQEERTLMYDASTEMARLLVGLLDATQLTIGTDRNANAYRSAVAYYAKKAFPERQGTVRISAYSARHAFKVDLKAAQWPDAKIAMAMGHVSTESSSYYGGAGKRSGAVSPISVTATNKVKVRKPYSSDRTNTLSPRVKLKVKPSK